MLSTLLIIAALAVLVIGSRLLVVRHYGKRGRRPPPFLGQIRMLGAMSTVEWLALATVVSIGASLIYLSGLVGNEA